MAFNESYKRWNVPKKNHFDENGRLKKGETLQGWLKEKYTLRYPEKYIGNPDLIIYRSGWEFSFCKWCDVSPSIKRWSSEPIRIPYYDRVSKLEECRRQGLDPNNPKNWVIKYYNTDFWIDVDQGNGNTQKMFIEIKPSEKLRKPIPLQENAPLRDQRRFNAKAKEYLINEAKFAALGAWAERNNAKFYVFTEKTLQNLIGKIWPENMK
jgi:TnsA endonuclease N terminal